MHNYPWRDVFFPWEQAYVLSDTGGGISVTPVHQPTCVSVCTKNSSLRRCQSFLCGVQHLQHVDLWYDVITSSGLDPGGVLTVLTSVAIELLKSWRPTGLCQRRWGRFSRTDCSLSAISDNYLWYSAFQTRAEQLGENLYKQTQCDYECITIQQTGNQHKMTCHATLQN